MSVIVFYSKRCPPWPVVSSLEEWINSSASLKLSREDRTPRPSLPLLFSWFFIFYRRDTAQVQHSSPPTRQLMPVFNKLSWRSDPIPKILYGNRQPIVIILRSIRLLLGRRVLKPQGNYNI